MIVKKNLDIKLKYNLISKLQAPGFPYYACTRSYFRKKSLQFLEKLPGSTSRSETTKATRFDIIARSPSITEYDGRCRLSTNISNVTSPGFLFWNSEQVLKQKRTWHFRQYNHTVKKVCGRELHQCKVLSYHSRVLNVIKETHVNLFDLRTQEASSAATRSLLQNNTRNQLLSNLIN